jgi:hypothetical protein
MAGKTLAVRCVWLLSSSISTSVIRECLACVEEGKTCRESWNKQARNIVQYAMNCQHQKVWTNAWQRPGVSGESGQGTLYSLRPKPKTRIAPYKITIVRYTSIVMFSNLLTIA